jgi:hypothetical protein
MLQVDKVGHIMKAAASGCEKNSLGKVMYCRTNNYFMRPGGGV